MKTLAKMLIISVVCIVAVTVSYIEAGYYWDITPDGTGFVSYSELNPQWTAKCKLRMQK